MFRLLRLESTEKTYAVSNTQRKVRPVIMIVKAEGPSGRAKIHSDKPETRIGSGPIPENYWLQRLD